MAAADWALLGAAVEHYARCGWRYVDMPFLARRDVVAVTCPDAGCMIEAPLLGGVLVGSAEQSFLEACVDGRLTPGRWCSCTPCFRIEPEFDELHQPFFMKVELFSVAELPDADLTVAIDDALSFMRPHAAGRLRTVRTEVGVDIELDGIEVGSYGIREALGVRWVYGTGVAVPRFGIAARRGTDA